MIDVGIFVTVWMEAGANIEWREEGKFASPRDTEPSSRLPTNELQKVRLYIIDGHHGTQNVDRGAVIRHSSRTRA